VCLRPATEGIHNVCVCIHVYVYMNILYQHTPKMICRRRGRGFSRLYRSGCVLCVFCVDLCCWTRVCFCLPGICSQSRYWLDLGACQRSSLATIMVRDSATCTVTHLGVPVFALSHYFTFHSRSSRADSLTWYSDGWYVFLSGSSCSVVDYGARHCYIKNDLYVRKT